MHGKGLVKLSVNHLSHILRSSTKAVICVYIVSEEQKQQPDPSNVFSHAGFALSFIGIAPY